MSRWYWEYRARRIAEMVQGPLALDAGCGEGVITQLLSKCKPGLRTVGLDALEENAVICQQHGVTVVCGDIYAMPFDGMVFDSVILSEVIEHLEEPRRSLDEVRRILKPRGLLAVVFPNDAAFAMARALMLRFKDLRFDPGHNRQWTHGDMKLLLRQTGFEPLRAASIPFRFWPVSLHGIIAAVKA